VKNTFGLVLALTATCLVGLCGQGAVHRGNNQETAKDLSAIIESLKQIPGCSTVISGAGTGVHLVCPILGIYKERDLENVKMLADDLSHIDTAKLRLYQFIDGICSNIECHDVPADKVKALISSELGFRADGEKTQYVRMNIITGSVSTLISIMSLCISGLTYRRGSKSAAPARQGRVRRPPVPREHDNQVHKS
jgi:hypothetical protein